MQVFMLQCHGEFKTILIPTFGTHPRRVLLWCMVSTWVYLQLPPSLSHPRSPLPAPLFIFLAILHHFNGLQVCELIKHLCLFWFEWLIASPWLAFPPPHSIQFHSIVQPTGIEVSLPKLGNPKIAIFGFKFENVQWLMIAPLSVLHYFHPNHPSLCYDKFISDWFEDCICLEIWVMNKDCKRVFVVVIVVIVDVVVVVVAFHELNWSNIDCNKDGDGDDDCNDGDWLIVWLICLCLCGVLVCVLNFYSNPINPFFFFFFRKQEIALLSPFIIHYPSMETPIKAKNKIHSRRAPLATISSSDLNARVSANPSLSFWSAFSLFFFFPLQQSMISCGSSTFVNNSPFLTSFHLTFNSTHVHTTTKKEMKNTIEYGCSCSPFFFLFNTFISCAYWSLHSFAFSQETGRNHCLAHLPRLLDNERLVFLF